MDFNDRLISAENLANALRRAGRPNQDAQAHLKDARRAEQIQTRLDAAQKTLDEALLVFHSVFSGRSSVEDRERVDQRLNQARKQHAAVQVQLTKNGSFISHLYESERLLKIRSAA